jgi:Flp pilus assembly protein TadD
MFHPHWRERWVEWWYPIQGIGGFTWANKEAAVGLAGGDGRIECGAAVTRPRPGSRVQVLSGDRLLKEVKADLSPEHPLRFDLSAEEAGDSVTLVVLDEPGREIIRHTQDQQPRTITLHEEQKSADESPGGLLRRGLRAEENAEPEAAWELYERAVMIDPACDAAALALGRLAIERKPGQAVPRLQAVAGAMPESMAAAYYLGVALARCGRDEEAEVALRRAAGGPEFGHAARVELGLSAMRRGDWGEAVSLLGEAAETEREDVRARAILAAALRRAGRPKEAAARLEAAIKQAPTDRLVLAETHFCMAALSRPRLAAGALRRLHEMVPADPDPWIEMALDYSSAGLSEEAEELLAWGMARSAAVRRSPLVNYLLAALLSRLGPRLAPWIMILVGLYVLSDSATDLV